MINRIVIFDRDNTLIKDKGYTHKLKDLKFLPQSIKVLKFLREKKVKIFIVTNQSGVARGFFKIKQVKKFHKKMNDILKQQDAKIDKFYFCPHFLGGKIKKYAINCNCRKPNNFFLELIKSNFKNKSKIIMFGDKPSDKQAANKSKIKFFYRHRDFYLQVKNIYKKYLF